MSLDKKINIIHRIEKKLGIPNLSSLLATQIAPTELQSLLLAVYEKRASTRKPREVLSDYQSNKFFIPSRIDPLLILDWDHTAFSHLPEEFELLELSPVSPFGCVSSVAPLSQDWILTTIRNMEVISDTTNVLALECALRRQKLLQHKFAKENEVHLACSHRMVRSQRYEGPNLFQHFRLFSLCSAGRTMGDLKFELRTIESHIQFYLDSITSFLREEISYRIVLLDMSPDSRNTETLSHFVEELNENLVEKEVQFEIVSNRKNPYYQDIRFIIYCSYRGMSETELVDGGVVDWTQKFLNNEKERLVISAIGTERVCEMGTRI